MRAGQACLALKAAAWPQIDAIERDTCTESEHGVTLAVACGMGMVQRSHTASHVTAQSVHIW